MNTGTLEGSIELSRAVLVGVLNRLNWVLSRLTHVYSFGLNSYAAYQLANLKNTMAHRSCFD